jgi:hypothetical protein
MRVRELHIAIWKTDDESEVVTKLFHTMTAAKFWLLQMAQTDDWIKLKATEKMTPGMIVHIQQTFMYI